MKRILFFLLLLVNLHLTTDNGSLSIGLGEVVAQRVQEERLSKVTTRGWGEQWQCPYCRNIFYDYSDKNIQDHLYYECDALNTTCPQCHDRVRTDALGWHTINECRFRKVQCPTCYEVCYAYEIEWGSHICSQPCMFCGRDVKFGEFCDCPGAIADGHKPWWMSGGIGSEDDDIFDPNNDGGGIGGATSQSGKEKKKHKHISLNDFLSLKGVKFLGNKKMTKASQGLNNMKTLHPQQDGVYECVPNAFAFMMELNGADYNTIQQILKDAAENEGYSMQQILPNTDSPQQTGFPMDIEYETLQSVFENYIQIVEYPNNFEDVEKCIDNGIPVAAYDNGCPQHMVVIIGYDDNNYYVSGGNEYGDVSVVNRMFLNGDSVFGIK